MAHSLEYDIDVRRLFSPATGILSVIGTLLFLTLPSQAQINAPPSSVTSPGFGGRPVNGPPPSVISVGPRGFAPNASVPNRPPINGTHNGGTHHRNHRNGAYDVPYLYAYPVPYAADSTYADDTPDSANDDADYQGGPTVFDRRGSGARSYIPPQEDPSAPHSADRGNGSDQTDTASTDSQSPPPPTLLVFKDGHELEIGNYAIVGTTLFDLTPGHPRRIPLADLDLAATQKENDERGIVFQVPSSIQGS